MPKRSTCPVTSNVWQRTRHSEKRAGPVLILDEATAFANPDNETKVQDAFNAMAKSRSVIMIAHRLSTTTTSFVLKEEHLAE